MSLRPSVPPWAALCLVAACGGDDGHGVGSPVPAGPPWFEEVAAERGIDFVHRSGAAGAYLFPEIMSSGAALFDMDGDGDLDAYLVQGGDLAAPDENPPNLLFENAGDGTFTDVTEGSGAGDRGYGMGVAAGDYDGDGDTDLYVTNVGRNTLLQNEGGGRFTDVTDRAGVAEPGWSTSAAFLDHDADGDLDLFVLNYIYWSAADELDCEDPPHGRDYCSPKSYQAPAPDALYRNEGDGTFTDVSSDSGLTAAFGNGLGVVCGDFDGDGLTDVFVANDGTPNQLWRNEGGGKFRDVALQAGCSVDDHGRPKAGMGTHAADVDFDGDEDLLVVNLASESDTFYRNEGDHFSDRTPTIGLSFVTRGRTRFGCALLDFNCDGRLDLFVANGRVTRPAEPRAGDPFAEENLLLAGEPTDRLVEVSPRGGVATSLSTTSRAAAFGDVDGDGGVDVLVANRDGPAHLLLNVCRDRGRWISFHVEEEGGRHALGAVVTLRAGERRLRRDVRAAYSYAASNDPRVHVGLGDSDRVEDVVVRWVDGSEEAFGGFDTGGVVRLARGAGTPR